jgi:hypothetical protein
MPNPVELCTFAFVDALWVLQVTLRKVTVVYLTSLSLCLSLSLCSHTCENRIGAWVPATLLFTFGRHKYGLPSYT